MPSPWPTAPGHVLDDPVWQALSTTHEHHSQVAAGGAAQRYEPEVSIFGALDRSATEADAWRAMAQLVGTGGLAVFCGDRTPTPPATWTELMVDHATQYVAENLASAESMSTVNDLIAVGNDEQPQMQELVAATAPGPFGPRTHELGGYVGVHNQDELVAMAGRRMAFPGWVEVSAVCVRPEHRRRGLAAVLTLTVAERIRAEGDEAFLHVRNDNTAAQHLYESIGFVRRGPMQFSAFRHRG